MYLIGFLASPLPYIFLFGLYLSGFAFFNWKAAAELADDAVSGENTLVIQAPLFSTVTAADSNTFSLAHHQQIPGGNPDKAGVDYCCPPMPDPWWFAYVPVSKRDLTHFCDSGLSDVLYLSQFTIRPPPFG